MKPIIIGTGITGSFLFSKIPLAYAFDKARGAGGRTSTKSLKEDWKFDFGATMFAGTTNVLRQQKPMEISIHSLLDRFGIDLQLKQIWDEEHFFPRNGISEISKAFLNFRIHRETGSTVEYGYHLTKIDVKSNGIFELTFTDQKSKSEIKTETKELYLTLPIPQILDIFSASPKNEILDRWTDFLLIRNQYRKTLISSLYYEKLDFPFQEFGLDPERRIPITTVLRANKPLEYLSFENYKYNERDNLTKVLLIQYSEEFSEEYFLNWMDAEKKPTPNSFPKIRTLLKEDLKLPYPSEIWNHRWKFAQNKNPILPKSEPMDLNSPKYLDWKLLAEETKLIPIGDFVFGPRIERQIIGTDMFLNEFLSGKYRW